MKSRSVKQAAARLAVATVTVFISSNVLAGGYTLSQCANGGVKDDVPHTECHEGWISGNANQSKAAYAEGQFLPYRVVMTGLAPDETYTYRFSWDTLKSGKHAIDYIGSFDYTVVDANPCDGLGELCSSATIGLTPIPNDPAVLAAGKDPIEGDMVLFGGTLEPIIPDDYGFASIGDVQSLSVTFTADQETAVLAWGGHIASPSDWGDGNTAADINGSPYHTSNIALLDSSGAAVASGAQDVALSAAAIYVPSSTTVRKFSNKPGLFTFTAALDRTTLAPDGEGATWTLADGGSVTFDAQDDGVLTITELGLPEGDWRIKSITCAKVGAGEVFSYVHGEDPETASAEFEVNEAGSFECDFVNEFFGAPVLDVVKRVVGVNDDCNESVLLDDQFDTRSINSGETVKYCYWISNTGSDAALDVSLVDDRASLAEEATIGLTGGSEIGGDAGIADLAPGESLAGELVVQLDVALGSVVTNTATAAGTGQYDDQEYTASDTATVTADQASACTLDASVNAGEGCPGASTEYVIKGSETAVNWCARVTWDGDAFLDLQGIAVTLQGTGVAGTGGDMAPNSSQDVAVGAYRDPADEDFTGTLVLTGTEGGLNQVTCSGSATINVLDPGLNLVKLASEDATCGNSDDAHDVEIINGESVWYCIEVSNSGDTKLTNVSIVDDLLGAIVEVPDLEPGDAWTWQSPEQTPTETVTNTAVATSVEPNTGTTIDSDRSSATVTVLSADVRVDKSVDPPAIVLCPPESEELFCSDQDGSGLFDASYAVTVKNLGPNVATGVTVTDDLPEGFIYTDNDGGCTHDGGAHQLVCDLSDMASGDEVTITITGQIDTTAFARPWQALTNQACARTEPVYLDPEQGNNCDDATTHISTGPTRTIGWWGTHPDGLAACLEFGAIDIGFVVLEDEAEGRLIDATVSTDPGAPNRARLNVVETMFLDDGDTEYASGVVLAKGLINAGTARWNDGTRRSEIDQERIKTGRQLAAAWCNEALFRSEFDYFYLGWDTIHAVMRGELCFPELDYGSCAGPGGKPDLDKIIASINALGSVADDFNNSGDASPVDFDAARADPDAPEDDPTDPSD
jgi:hypothetical protein